MADTKNLWTFKKDNGGPLTIKTFNAANAAVGTALPISIQGDVSSAHPTFLQLSDNIRIEQMPCKAATGVIAVEVNGKEQFQCDYAQNQETNQARPVFNLEVPRGATIAFRVVTALPA